MYISLHVALSCLLLSISKASEGVLPITRGGATAISKYSEDHILEQQQKFAVPRSDIKTDEETVANNDERHTSGSKPKSSSSRGALTSRILKKRSKKNSVIQINDQPLHDNSISKQQIDVISSELTQQSTMTSPIQEVVTEIAVETFIEPMCRPDEGRFALFPIRNHRMWEMYKKHVASFWTVSEVSFRGATSLRTRHNIFYITLNDPC